MTEHPSIGTPRPGDDDRAALNDGDPADRCGADTRVAAKFRSLLWPHLDPRLRGIDSRLPGFEIAYEYVPQQDDPTQTGGDFLDIYGEPNLMQIGVVLGDVSGKGLEAAARAVATKFAARGVVTSLRWPARPGEALMDIHNALLQTESEAFGFVSMLFGLINAKDGTFTFASAGHPLPFVLRPAGVERPMALTGPAMGVTRASLLEPLPAEPIELAPGDAVLLFTDGLSEMRDPGGRFYEDARMSEALEELQGLPAGQLLEGLVADARDFAGGRPTDDLALVLLRRCTL
jgi:phosphoserine phosphatase RsbU/P